jgi:hypothetical protein
MKYAKNCRKEEIKVHLDHGILKNFSPPLKKLKKKQRNLQELNLKDQPSKPQEKMKK